MKNILIIAIFLGISIVKAEESKVFYYHKDKKIFLNKIENTKVFEFSKTVDMPQKENIINKLTDAEFIITEISPFDYSIFGNIDQLKYLQTVLEAKANGDILYISDMLMYRDSTLQWTYNEISIQIHTHQDLITILQKNEIPFTDFKQTGSNKQTYIVELDVTKKCAIDYANILSETGNVVWAQPSFWKLRNKPKHEKFYSDGQNIRSPYFDLNLQEAWQISTGEGVKVAVLDDGVHLNHQDLVNNLLPGYDATNLNHGGSYGTFCGWVDNHGTLCTGIIAAEGNYNPAVKGVAYNSDIIPIRVFYGQNYCFKYDDKWFADGIRHAWEYLGADILSCSWGGGSSGMLFDIEIDIAVTHGRGALGSIVVFASGNGYSDYVDFPACKENVITVGAINRDGRRRPSSQYGTDLDVMAPGEDILTTDVGNRYSHFSATSAACPHVAGVAALILSLNPNLTSQEVRNIIESTTDKIRDDIYDYDLIPERPNGTWNDQMGYGLINAYSALQATCVNELKNQEISWLDRTVIGCENLEVDNITVIFANLTLEAPGNITIEDTIVYIGSNLTIKAEGDVIIVNNLEIKANAELVIRAGGKVSIQGSYKVNPGAKVSISNTP